VRTRGRSSRHRLVVDRELVGLNRSPDLNLDRRQFLRPLAEQHALERGDLLG
jgi:hypothetical protein